MSDKIKECWEWLRKYGTQADKERFRPVYQEMERLKKRVLELEKIHDKHMAPQMFKPIPTDKELLIQQQIEKRRLEARQEITFHPLKERLKKMIEENRTDSKEWQSALKWNRLTHEQAIELANKQ